MLPGFAEHDYLDEDAFWAQVERARDLRARLAQRIRAGDVAHDPKGRRLPVLVRPLADVPDQARMSDAERAAARRSTARGEVFVSAGAGTGKTTVLVERFVARGVRRGSTSSRCS